MHVTDTVYKVRLQSETKYEWTRWTFARIRWHHWKKGLKINDITNFESDESKTNEGIAPQSRKILQTFEWWEGGGGGYKLGTLRSYIFAR